ncbi:MAG TPA: hypothetical protein VFE61_25485 [Candidatus Sulfotelmatobacter sp.]|jgi:hypothetical protein|nr:hypothetical protein [Candidatus Sulfotelmatobacter sp.]
MKTVTRMLALTLTILPLLAVAQLNSSDRIVTQVPFEFMVGNKAVPAGECVVTPATMDLKTLVIRNGEASVSLFTTAQADETKTAAANYALVFHKYGNRTFLWGMKIAGSRILYRLPESKAEAELRAQNVPATEQTLLASRR